MNRDRIIMMVAIAALILFVGALTGILVGQTIPAEVQEDEVVADPVERFELGRDSFAPPKVKPIKNGQTDPNENFEFGRTRNGKRLLVPNESAIKKKRMQRLKEQREHDAWRKQAFGEETGLIEKQASDEGRELPHSDIGRVVEVVRDPERPPVTINGRPEDEVKAEGREYDRGSGSQF